MTSRLISPDSRETIRELTGLAWPVILARLGIMTMGLTDALVIANWSAKELGYHALAWAPHSVMVTTAVGLMLGVQVMTARALGEGRPQEAGAVLRRGIVYALQIGIASALALILFGPWALTRIGLEDGLGEGARAPLIVFALSMPAYLVSVAAQFFLEALSKPKPGMMAMWIANAINLALNLVLVPDLLGLNVQGATASAWATFGARTALAVFLVLYIVRLPEARALGVFARPARAHADAVEQRRIGYGGGASYFIEVGAFAAMTLIAGQLGVAATGAWAVVLNVASIVFMVPLGLASATAVLVGRAYGARDSAAVLRSGLAGVILIAILCLLVSVIVWPSATFIVKAYTREPTLIAIAAPALVLATLFFVADGIQVVAAQALRAAGDVLWPTLMHIFSYGVVMIPLGWLLAHSLGLGVNGIVLSVVIASLVSASLLAMRFSSVARRTIPS